MHYQWVIKKTDGVQEDELNLLMGLLIESHLLTEGKKIIASFCLKIETKQKGLAMALFIDPRWGTIEEIYDKLVVVPIDIPHDLLLFLSGTHVNARKIGESELHNLVRYAYHPEEVKSLQDKTFELVRKWMNREVMSEGPAQ